MIFYHYYERKQLCDFLFAILDKPFQNGVPLEETFSEIVTIHLKSVYFKLVSRQVNRHTIDCRNLKLLDLVDFKAMNA